jgi:hypothetical protein
MSSTGVSSTQAPVTSISTQIDAPNPLPTSRLPTHQFFAKHGMAVRAVGLEVKDATAAFDASGKWCRPMCWNQRLFLLSRAKAKGRITGVTWPKLLCMVMWFFDT